nr:ubiquitin carboxyl-terminal hydrolase 15-like isoform X1 [Cherax quadricarinatus]
MLEETDSWFCPKCERKQPATKTISVWRYPPYLIIHLERFLFHGTMSTKLDDRVIFPLDGLDVSDYVASGASISQLYNLYACVCHMGVAQAGHYTAFARSPVTGEWHHFNDDSVTRQKPREEEYSTAYLLFYHRQGTKFDLNLPQHFACVDTGIPKHAGDCAEEMACSSGASTSNFMGPSSSLTDTGVNVVEEGPGQPPVFQINKIIDNLNEACDKDNSMEE